VFVRFWCLEAGLPRSSEALLGKRSAGGRLEVLLEGEGPVFVTERYVGLDRPRREFRSVRHLAGVMLLQSGSQIVGNRSVVMFAILGASENVNVEHEISSGEWLAEP
jgi:hypothetical protein